LTLSSILKEKVIRLHKEGLGRNAIARQLKGELSSGATGSIIRAYKKQQTLVIQSSQPQHELSDVSMIKSVQPYADVNISSIKEAPSRSPQPGAGASIRTAEPINIDGSPTLIRHGGVGLKPAIINTNSNSRVTTSPEELTEVEFKKNKDISVKDHTITPESWEENGYSQSQKGGPLSWLVGTNGQAGPENPSTSSIAPTKPNFSTLEEPIFVSEEVNIGSNNIINNVKEAQIKEAQEGIDKCQFSTHSDSNKRPSLEQPTTIDKTAPRKFYHLDEVERTDRFDIERKAWDFYGKAWSKIQQEIDQEKSRRHHEMLVIDRQKRRLEQMQLDLTTRENRILESEPYLGLAKKLQETKLTLEDTLPWIETINEVAQIQNLNLREAAILVSQELKLNRQFGGVERQLEMAQGQLKMLNITITEKQPLLTTLLKLYQNGVKDDDIIGLSKMIDLSRMGREWMPGQGQGQCNENNGNGNLQQPNNSNGNFTDWVRLNLLRNNTANMLNRMGTNRSN
jgi:hypothetical protein